MGVQASTGYQVTPVAIPRLHAASLSGYYGPQQAEYRTPTRLETQATFASPCSDDGSLGNGSSQTRRPITVSVSSLPDPGSKTLSQAGRAWYVARTKRRRERQVSAVLGLREVEHYLPMTRPRGVAREVRQPEPFFPCYLFVKLDLAKESRRVRFAPGVTHLLGGDEGPTPLSEELIEGIRRRMKELEAEGSRPRFVRGEQVVIARGPLEGLEAVFDRRLSAQGRSEVLVGFVSRLVRAKVDESDLAPVPAIRLAGERRPTDRPSRLEQGITLKDDTSWPACHSGRVSGCREG